MTTLMTANNCYLDAATAMSKTITSFFLSFILLDNVNVPICHRRQEEEFLVNNNNYNH